MCPPHIKHDYLSNTSRSPDVSLLLGQHRKQWPNIKPALGERIVVDGIAFVLNWGPENSARSPKVGSMLG